MDPFATRRKQRPKARSGVSAPPTRVYTNAGIAYVRPRQAKQQIRRKQQTGPPGARKPLASQNAANNSRHQNTASKDDDERDLLVALESAVLAMANKISSIESRL